jgi:hypothetical protein
MKEQRKRFLSSFKPTDMIEETLTKYRQSKTNRQLGAWFGLFSKIVLEVFNDRGYDTSYIFKLPDPTGIEISPDLLKDYMYAMCPVFRDEKRLTMRDMNTLEMADFFDKCRNFAASQWSIYVPEPQKNWKELKK